VVLTIGAEHHGVRIDKCLADRLSAFSRSYLQQLLIQGDVDAQGMAQLKPSSKVKAGDCVTVNLRPTDQAQAFKAEDLALDVVHEDSALLVVNKPAGLVVHPAAGNWSGTLMNGLLHHWEGAAQLPRAGIVHRLDKDTSGLMVVAKSRMAMEALVRMIAAREVRRYYLAIAQRPWCHSEVVTVEAAIGRDPHHRLKMAVLPPDAVGAKPAKTQFVAVERQAELSLLACKLFTGRTHQIRVHLASIGHPIAGDGVYGGSKLPGLDRQALHATQLAFPHPVTGQIMTFDAPLPTDMAGVLSSHGLHYNPQPLNTDRFEAPVL
jgi:23S rRNA pseudouridine1911/1915/1917 synthase